MYANILLPLDGSELAEKALGHAINLAKPDSATVHLVHVFTHNPEGVVPVGGLEQDRSVAATDELSRQIRDASISRVEEYLDHTATKVRDEGLETQTAILEGSVHEEIIKYARQNDVGLVTMSTHGRGGVRRMLIGSVADKVIRSGETPVMIIPG